MADRNAEAPEIDLGTARLDDLEAHFNSRLPERERAFLRDRVERERLARRDAGQAAADSLLAEQEDV